MINLKLRYYSSEFLRIKRGFCKGKVVNAKPFLLLATIDLISENLVWENQIHFNSTLEERYLYYHSKYSDGQITEMYKPFYYMISDGFWHIEWESCDRVKVSNGFLRENVKYAQFDNALWDLLQDPKCRQTLREVIIQNFLTTKQ